jgi:hypothetical protein
LEQGNEGHFQVNLDDKNYICQEHGNKFVAYCLDCNANFCENCKPTHDKDKHDIIEYNAIRVSKDLVNKYNEDVDKQKEILIDFTETVRCLFDEILNTIENYINSYIMIERGLIRRFKSGFHNYQLLRNLKNKEIFKLDIIESMKSLNEKYEKTPRNIQTLFEKNLMNIYSRINNTKKENLSEEKPKDKSGTGELKLFTTINYKLNGTTKIRNIKLFDPAFVQNNKNKLKMKIESNYKYNDGKKVEEKKNLIIYDGKLIEYYKNNMHYDIQDMKIELYKYSDMEVTDLSYMFNNC